MKRKIVFGKSGVFSHTNTSMEMQLRRTFPDHELVVIDVREQMFAHRLEMFVNAFHTISEYGHLIVRRQRSFQWTRWITSYMSRRIRRNFIRMVRDLDNVDFTFQTQSIYNLKVPELPHFIYTDHTLLTNRQYTQYDNVVDMYSRQWQALEGEIYENADRIFTMSRHVTDTLIEDYGQAPGKIACVGVGSNAYMDGVYPDVSTRTADDYRGKNILFLGNNWELKGGPELVQAFRLVLEDHPQARLTIVGTSPQVDLPNVDVIGRVPLAEVHAYYKKASVFCMPTKADAFGIVFLEAFMNALPVVALKVGALPDIVHNDLNGYLVEAGDIAGLAAHLSDLLGDPEKCRRFGLYGREMVMKDYTWDRVGEKIRDEILGTLNQPVN